MRNIVFLLLAVAASGAVYVPKAEWRDIESLIPAPYFKVILETEELYNDPNFFAKVVFIALKTVRLFIQTLHARQNYLNQYITCACPQGNIKADVIPFTWGSKINEESPIFELARFQNEGLLYSKKMSEVVKVANLECPKATQCSHKYNDKFMDFLVGNEDSMILISVWQSYLTQFYPSIFQPLYGYEIITTFQKYWSQFLRMFSAPLNNYEYPFYLYNNGYNGMKPVDFSIYTMNKDFDIANPSTYNYNRYFNPIYEKSSYNVYNPYEVTKSFYPHSPNYKKVYDDQFHPYNYNKVYDVNNLNFYSNGVLNRYPEYKNINGLKVFNRFNDFNSFNDYGQFNDFNKFNHFSKIKDLSDFINVPGFSDFNGYNKFNNFNSFPFSNYYPFDKGFTGEHHDGKFNFGKLNGMYHTYNSGGDGNPAGAVVTFEGPNTSGSFVSRLSSRENEQGTVSTSSATTSLASAGPVISPLGGQFVIEKSGEVPVGVPMAHHVLGRLAESSSISTPTKSVSVI